MYKIKLNEIRSYLKERDAVLIKCNFKLNSSTAYKVQYGDGTFKTFTINGLKQAFLEGVL